MSDNTQQPRGVVSSWVNFWFAPADPIGLNTLRVLGGLLFLAWLLPFAGDPAAWFGLNGWFDATAYEETSRLQMLPPHLFSWSLLYLCGTSGAAITACYWLSIAVLALFTAGIWTRLTGVLTWAVVVSFTASPVTSWDADPFLRMLAFYLMLGYLLIGQSKPNISMRERLLGGRGAGPSMAANLAVRLFQVNFAIAIFASGLHKLQAQEWWQGLAYWFFVHPPLQTTPEQVEAYSANAADTLFYLSLKTYLILAWQIGFPLFAWKRSLRLLLLGGAAVGLVGNVFVFHWPLLGPITAIGCLSYLTAAEWHWALDRLTRTRDAFRSAPPATAERATKARVAIR